MALRESLSCSRLDQKIAYFPWEQFSLSLEDICVCFVFELMLHNWPKTSLYLHVATQSEVFWVILTIHKINIKLKETSVKIILQKDKKTLKK